MALIFHESAGHIPHLNLTKSLYTTTTSTQSNLTSKIPPTRQGSTNHVNTDKVHQDDHNTTLALIIVFFIVICISSWKWCRLPNYIRYKLSTDKDLKNVGSRRRVKKIHSVAVKETQERKNSLDITDVGNWDVQTQTQNSTSPRSQSQQECTGGVDEADITDRK